jgi:hypothetical protein
MRSKIEPLEHIMRALVAAQAGDWNGLLPKSLSLVYAPTPSACADYIFTLLSIRAAGALSESDR